MIEPHEEQNTSDTLRESEADLRHTHQLARIGSWSYEVGKDRFQWSDEMYAIFGIRPSDGPPSPKLILFCIHPDDVAVFEAHVASVNPHCTDYRITLPGGAVRHIHEEVRVEGDTAGNPVRLHGTAQDITEQKRAEEKLRESENRFRALFENINIVALVIDPEEGRILDANEASAAYYGWSREQLRKMLISQINTLPTDEIQKRMNEVKLRKLSSLLLKHRRADGSVRDVEVHSGPIPFEGRTALYSVVHDVTERRQTEDALKESEEKFSRIFQKAPLLITLSEPETGCLLDVNEKFLEISGYARDEVVGRTVPDLGWISEEQRARMYPILQSQRRVTGIELFLQRKDGGRVICLYNGEIILVGGKQRLLSIAQDITERKKTENDLELFRTLLNRSNDAIFVNDLQSGRFLDMNDRACSSLGYSREELLQMGVRDIEATFPDDSVWQDHTAAVKRRGALLLEGMHRRKDGSTFPAEINVSYADLGTAEYMIAVVRDITERKRAEAVLRERERQLAESQRIAHVGSWEHHLKSGRVFWSDELFRLLGLDPRKDPADFTRFFKTVHPDDQPALKDAIDTTLRENKPFSIVYRLALQDGTMRVIDAQAELVLDDAGEPAVLKGTAQDITERKRQEQTIQQSEKMLQTIFDAEPECVKLLDANANLIMMNRAGLEMLQVDSLTQVKGQCVCPLVTSEYRDAFMDLTRRVFQGASGTLEFEMTGMRGKHLWMETHAVPMRNERDEIIALLGVTRDITERKKGEQERERLAKAVSIVTEGIAVTDEKDRYIYVNDAHAKFYGYAPHELLGKTWRDVTPRELVPVIESALALTLHKRENGVWSGEAPGLRRDGTRITTEITATARWSEKGDYAGHICVVRDITERKRIDEALRASEARFRSIIENAASGIIVADAGSGKILYANPEICRMLGYSGKELLELDISLIHPAEELARVRKAFAVAQGIQTVCLRKDGTAVPVEIKAVEIELDGRRCIAGFFTDITERRLLEEERLKTQKLESVGTLAGGIAHDFNNLLQAVFGYISMAKLTSNQREKSLAMLEQAEKALHRSVSLTSQLLTFSKGGKPMKKVLALPPIIESAVKFALSGSRSGHTMTIAPDLRPVEADEGQIGQVFQNIVLNADQAMPLGGMITIGARNSAGHEGFVEISVRDTGVGIPAEYLTKIFDPYFTTKEKGSGLGLATSYSIIKNHGGEIAVTSEQGRGSTFTVLLPASKREPQPPVRSGAPAPVRRGRVLVMDDEEAVRGVAAELLRTLDQDVEVAAHGGEALEKYQEARSAGRPFDVVILDITVRGGMGGAEAMRKLREIEPGIKAIVSSGYSADSMISDYESYGFRACLVKPYELEKLRSVLNGLLG